MQNIVKPTLFLLLFSFVIITVSCNKEDDEKKVKRTFQTELHELDSIVKTRELEGYDVDTTDLGVYYIIHDEGTGPYPQAGDTCYLEYIGYLPDGSVFDDSRTYESIGVWEFIYLYQDLITGLNDAIALMNKDTWMEVIIPSQLAYGKDGYGLVPPYTTVVFMCRMHDVKPAADEGN